MLRIAWKMLAGDRGKYAGLVIGIAFTSFLVTFAASFFCGFMTRGFALVSDNPAVDVWVMDPAVRSAELTANIQSSAVSRVRGVDGVRFATGLALAAAEVRFPDGRFQSMQLIAVDDATLAGVPPSLPDAASARLELRSPDAVLVAAGGSVGKLDTPLDERDIWPRDGPHLDARLRPLAPGDELLVNDHRVVVRGYASALPRFPPRPLLYMTLSNAVRVLPPERHRLTFVLAAVAPGANPQAVARRIEAQTGFRARTAAEFEEDTVRWALANSEDVGDVGAMLTLAVAVGFGATAVLLYIFTTENLRQYAVLKGMGATSGLLLEMVFVQAGACAVIGTGLGIGACGLVAPIVNDFGFPFRMMWFTPVLGGATVLVVSISAALLSARRVLRTEPALAFAAHS